MKWRRFFFLFLCISTFLHALSQEQCTVLKNHAAREWKNHRTFIKEYHNWNAFDMGDSARQNLLDALACCAKALEHTEALLQDIASSHQKAKHLEPWRRQLKETCVQDKKQIAEEIQALESLLKEVEGVMAFNKASAFYQKSQDKAVLAHTKERNCARGLNHVEAVAATLNDISKLYQEAAKLAAQALACISPYPSQEKNQKTLKQSVEAYLLLVHQYRKDAAGWPAAVAAQKNCLKADLDKLKEEAKQYSEKGLTRSCYELQKYAVSILEQLIESSAHEEGVALKMELAQLHTSVAAFEREADWKRLSANVPQFSEEEFKRQEKVRKELFYKSAQLLDLDFLPFDAPPKTLSKKPILLAMPLDGQVKHAEGAYNLYTEQFYRFLVASESAVAKLLIKVYENAQLVHFEKIVLPAMHTPQWEQYLENGMIYIPETRLNSQYGLDLRISIVCDPAFKMIVAQKSSNSRYAFSFAVDQEAIGLISSKGSVERGKDRLKRSGLNEAGMAGAMADEEDRPGEALAGRTLDEIKPIADQDSFLYACSFSVPPPWQLETLRKPAATIPHTPLEQVPLTRIDLKKGEAQLCSEEDTFSWFEFDTHAAHFAILDQLIEELQCDPLALASYVHNEIALTDPHLFQLDGVFQAPGILQSPFFTLLAKQGSPWEQCQLLVYLLRKAGFQTLYALGECALPKHFFESMFFTKLPEEQQTARLQYPWVVFYDGQEWISLFPWIKEMHVREGHDLYSCMPEEYATAHSWIFKYLQGDERILKQIGPDGNDTAGVLFVRFIEEELRKHGLSTHDVGIQRVQLKKQFSAWKDFPRPVVVSPEQFYGSLKKVPHLFACLKIEICSRRNPEKNISQTIRLVDLNQKLPYIRFSATDLYLGFANEELTYEHACTLDAADLVLDVQATLEVPLAPNEHYRQSHTFSIAKGTHAVLCCQFGGANSQTASQFQQQFAREKEEQKRLSALLAYVGAAYFDKCSRTEQMLADLHKVRSTHVFGVGLAKLSTDLSKSASDPAMPQVDMVCFHQLPHAGLCHQEPKTAHMQYQALVTADFSSNEHQILREVFQDQCALSTIRLLQLAHQQHLKNSGEKEGFLSFSGAGFDLAEIKPQEAQNLYFAHIKDLNLLELKAEGQWRALKEMFNQNSSERSWTYAYMTPAPVKSLNGAYNEMGTLIFASDKLCALISSNTLLSNGGLGSPLPHQYLTPASISEWQLMPSKSSSSSYSLQFASQASQPESLKWTDDVRPEHKSWLHQVADPVDTVSGAFYVDEVDLCLPGPFTLVIRRNYNSQNPLMGDFGCGWKLSLNPYLIEQEGKRFVSELDGTVITYSYNPNTACWEALPEDNPDLSNFTQNGIGSSANPFHIYIKGNVLYAPDGSKRFFEEGQLKKWVDSKGNSLAFSYANGRLTRIESSQGEYCGFHYNHESKISEVYAKDGRRVFYEYNFQGDLVKVTLPNTATISYEYDRAHRIIRESKPHGKVLENIYDEQGRVTEQRGPMGPQQKMIATARFDYADGVTTVSDAGGGKTIYKIFQKQIYQVIDPLGYTTLQAWFIDAHSWFDPFTEQIVAWDQPGAAIRSLKSISDKRGLTTNYFYDCRGNPVEISLEGKDLTGNGASRIAKKFVYNALNLCLEEEVCGQKTLTTYDAAFPYLPKRVETFSGDTLIRYLDLHYNACGQLEREECSGAVTLWRYNQRGYPCQKTQLTGTNDPDLVTTYAYNSQGQCIKTISTDGTQLEEYDLMGNRIASKLFSPCSELISSTNIGYDLNNAPLWRQTANPGNILCIDYNAAGLIKAVSQALTPGCHYAYTLYDYDSRGCLIEETDARGFITYREYDALGKVILEAKGGAATYFSYEPGGLLGTITTPSGACSTRHYTSNGLLQEERYPDGTKRSYVYDFFGRPVQETKNGITWQIEHDDARHQVKRIHQTTQQCEISEYDARGNLIRMTDTAGYTLERKYDGLNRIISETTPSGQTTLWHYLGNTVCCTLPNGESSSTCYAGGRGVQTQVTDFNGRLIASSSCHLDPVQQREEIVQGAEKTVTWNNTQGLPVKIQKGSIISTYEYDACGNCVAALDGDGRKTRSTYDGLGRLIQKELPDGSQIDYTYDLDSNLTAYRLPNGTVWTAAYDALQRKLSEELRAGTTATQRWEYRYEKGYLQAAIDPMQRMHRYYYDAHGRLVQDAVEGRLRTYTYDPRGLVAAAEQRSERDENTLVERTYDADGRLCVESIYLNSALIQKSSQNWTATGRTLQIGDHVREMLYQNQCLVQLSSPGVHLSYTYGLSGSLQSKANSLSSAKIDYNTSGLPVNVLTRTPQGTYQEQLTWHPSGKLESYSAPNRQQQFTYNTRGSLKSAGAEEYEFDFGTQGIGVRTAAPHWRVPSNGLDAFGRIEHATAEETPAAIEYDPLGQMIRCAQRQLEWDPWGRLVKVADPESNWEASYDAFGRRLQTCYKTDSQPALTTTSYYDPESEFQEIGVQYAEAGENNSSHTYWKFYGPDGCDALADEAADLVVMLHNCLGQLWGAISHSETLCNETIPAAYGPQAVPPPLPADLMAYAQSLNWQSRAPDPTGLIWMGARHYDPRSGCFLSPDPVSYPLCTDLYAYAKGDPINFVDPDGRFASYAYRTAMPIVIDAIAYSPAIKAANRMAAFFADHRMFTGSKPFKVDTIDLPNGRISFTNGIDNSFAESMQSASYLSHLAGGYSIYGTYNRSNSAPIDVAECVFARLGMHSPPVRMIKKRWDSLISIYQPEVKFLEICHSGGAAQLKNALVTSPKYVQQRIIAVAIAPSDIIPKSVCYQSFNYISRRDFVTHLDFLGKSLHDHELHVLEPDPKAKFWDHEFQSPTFEEKLQAHILDYINIYGVKR
jgi:RHS repeat-associated protein